LKLWVTNCTKEAVRNYDIPIVSGIDETITDVAFG
jgi:hypothetical protein